MQSSKECCVKEMMIAMAVFLVIDSCAAKSFNEVKLGIRLEVMIHVGSLNVYDEVLLWCLFQFTCLLLFWFVFRLEVLYVDMK